MKARSNREIRRHLASRPVAPAPAELLDRIKAEIPETIEPAGPELQDEVHAAVVDRSRPWLMAASLFLLVGSAAVLTWRLAPTLMGPNARPRPPIGRAESEIATAEPTPAATRWNGELRHEIAKGETDDEPEPYESDAIPKPLPEELGYPAAPPSTSSLRETLQGVPSGSEREYTASDGDKLQRYSEELQVTSEAPAIAPAQTQAATYGVEITRNATSPGKAAARRLAPHSPAGIPGGVSPEPMYDTRRGPSPPPQALAASPDDMFFRAPGTSPLVDASEDPLSTFGLDVDTGSYTLLRSYLDIGQLPPPEALRVEELVNFFDYGDTPPRRGDFALGLEGAPLRSRHRGVTHVLRIGVRARDLDLEERKPASLVFLVDVSGSMQRGDRLELVKQALELLLDQLRADDTVGLVVYESLPRVVLEPTADKERIRAALRSLYPGGSTNLEGGLGLAYEMAARVFRRDGINRVILCSDGVANVGVVDPEALLRGVADEATRGLELTAVGFGMGNYNDELMERLADRGDGSYAYVDDLDEAHRIFVENLTGTLQTVAGDARIQVRFAPDAVVRYRLLGYQNRALPDEVFRRPDVDAGEIGAGHRVSALYEVELAPQAEGRALLAEVTLRYRSRATGDFEEVSAQLRAADLEPSWRAASPGLRLASLVADLGEVLGSRERPDADLDGIFRAAQPLVGEFPGRTDVAELVALIGKARNLQDRRGR